MKNQQNTPVKSNLKVYKFLHDADYAFRSILRGELTGTTPASNFSKAFQDDFNLRIDFSWLTSDEPQDMGLCEKINDLNKTIVTYLQSNYALLCFSEKMQINNDRCFSVYSNNGFVVEYNLEDVANAIHTLYSYNSGRINHKRVQYVQGPVKIERAARRFIDVAEQIQAEHITDERIQRERFSSCLDGEEYQAEREEILQPFWHKSFDYEWEAEYRFIMNIKTFRMHS